MVKRYTISASSLSVPVSFEYTVGDMGDWVSYDDYAALEEKLRQKDNAVEALKLNTVELAEKLRQAEGTLAYVHDCNSGATGADLIREAERLQGVDTPFGCYLDEIRDKAERRGFERAIEAAAEVVDTTTVRVSMVRADIATVIEKIRALSFKGDA